MILCAFADNGRMESQKKLEPRLVIIEGKDKGRILELKGGTQTVGRAKAEIILNDPRISRSHVSLSFDVESGTVNFTDLNSLNGTLINGVAKSSGELKDGDQIQLGDTKLDLQLLEVAPEVTAQKHLAEMLQKKTLPRPSTPSIAATPELSPPSNAPSDAKGSNASGNDVARNEQNPNPPQNRRTLLKLVSGGMASLIVVGCFLLFSGRGSKDSPGVLEENLSQIADRVAREQWDEALAGSIELSVKFPNSAKPHMQAGYLYTRLKKFELAIGAYQKAHALPDAPPLVHAKLLRLYGLVEAKDGIAAEMEHVDNLIKNGPFDRDTFVEIALCFIDIRAAIGESFERPFILAKALQNEIAPLDPVGFKLEAQILGLQGRFQDALLPLQKTLELAPVDEWPFENLTFAYLKLNNLEATQGMALEWMRRHPNSAKPHLVMAYLKLNEGNSLEALPYAQKVIELGTDRGSPLYSEALSVMGQVYTKQGQVAEAEQLLRESCSLGFAPSCEFFKALNSGDRSASSEPATTPTPTAAPMLATPQGTVPIVPSVDTPKASAPASSP